jgi:hypothetical protein
VRYYLTLAQATTRPTAECWRADIVPVPRSLKVPVARAHGLLESGTRGGGGNFPGCNLEALQLQTGLPHDVIHLLPCSICVNCGHLHVTQPSSWTQLNMHVSTTAVCASPHLYLQQVCGKTPGIRRYTRYPRQPSGQRCKLSALPSALRGWPTCWSACCAPQQRRAEKHLPLGGTHANRAPRTKHIRAVASDSRISGSSM